MGACARRAGPGRGTKCARAAPPPPCAQELWTGKQMFGLLLRPNARAAVWVSLELPEREYSKAGLHMCPKDGCARGRARAAGI